MLDQASALLLLLTAILALASALAGLNHRYTRSSVYHALFQFLLAGVNGAFLTGDLFNLFVCFEILLAASYGLLVQGGGPQRVRAALHYVVLNLLGSALFLIAIGLIYGSAGTLNLADLGRIAGQLSDSQRALFDSGVLLLLTVFGLKAALLPLQFWLPAAYASAAAPVAALFAIMTKVGAYSMLRVFGLVGAEPVASWLFPAALLTLLFGAAGMLAASSLQRQVAHLVVMSAGTLLAGISLFTPQAAAAALYYLVHSALVSAALFLLAGEISRQRGGTEDRLVDAPPMPGSNLLGALFLLAAVAAAMTLSEGTVFPHASYGEADPECGLDVSVRPQDDHPHGAIVPAGLPPAPPGTKFKSWAWDDPAILATSNATDGLLSESGWINFGQGLAAFGRQAPVSLDAANELADPAQVFAHVVNQRNRDARGCGVTFGDDELSGQPGVVKRGASALTDGGGKVDLDTVVGRGATRSSQQHEAVANARVVEAGGDLEARVVHRHALAEALAQTRGDQHSAHDSLL